MVIPKWDIEWIEKQYQKAYNTFSECLEAIQMSYSYKLCCDDREIHVTENGWWDIDED
jgi:hypothetical protein